MTATSSAPAPAVPTHTATLRAKVLRGLGWKVGSQVVLQLSRLAVALTLARLLTPHQYGVAGMVLVLSAFVIPFADIGLGAALVQRQSLTEADRSTAFWMSIGAGVVFTSLGVACSSVIASFYHQPQVGPLFAALSFTFVITSLSATHRSLLVRDLNFRSLEIRVLLGTIVGAAAAIGLAALGFGAWALVAQELAVASISTAILWVLSPWRPSFAFSMTSVRSLGKFGSNAIGARFFSDLNQNVDNLLIGRFVGAAALGAYALAYNVMLVPVTRVVAPIQEVMYPALSRMQDDGRRMADAWLRVVRVVALVTMPALIGVIVVAPDLVPVVFGAKWNAAVPVLQALAWVGVLQSLQGVNSAVLQAYDRTATLFRYSAFAFVVSLAAFVVGLHWGITGVAVCYAATSTVVMPSYMLITARTIGVSAGGLLANVGGVAQASAGMALVVWATRHLLLTTTVPEWLRLFTCVPVGMAAFLALSVWRAPHAVSDVRNTLRRQKPSLATD